eukprot:TRINITY_DN65739_c0_g1_i1.p1 TRINITY_DN65739_c0_g1~~TRINITY_DN65739_c0_g1_i1.p1  ORF type:complete len:572 (+),score=194.02 TRINITY_DN65739_c0_g1_i1:3-1718(+)
MGKRDAGQQPPQGGAPHKRTRRLTYRLTSSFLSDMFYDAQDAAQEGHTRRALRQLLTLEAACRFLQREDGTLGGAEWPEDEVNPPLHILLSAACNSIGEIFMDRALDSCGQRSLAGASRKHASDYFSRAIEAHPAHLTARMSLTSLQRDAGEFSSLESIAECYEEVVRLATPPGSQKPSEVESADWRAVWVVGPNSGCTPIALYHLALLYAQMCRFPDLSRVLSHFDARYSLSKEVWSLSRHGCHRSQPESAAFLKSKRLPARRGSATVALKSGVLSPNLAAAIRQAFHPGSPYWKATGYSSRGYFSFFYDPACRPRILVEEAIQQVIAGSGLPEGSVKATEWWVHTRMGTRDLGHQLHFDTEEKTLEATGEFIHPLKSAVVYLSGNDTGGMTLCIDQTTSLKTDADVTNGVKGYGVFPSDGGVLYFNGDLLHGVLPAGIARGAPQRLTLLVALWGTSDFAPRKDPASIGPQTPLPLEEAWVKSMQAGSLPKEPVPRVSSLPVYAVGSVWERLVRAEGEGAYPIPCSIDQRFFAASLDFKALTVRDHEAKKGMQGGDADEEEEEEEEEDAE